MSTSLGHFSVTAESVAVTRRAMLSAIIVPTLQSDPVKMVEQGPVYSISKN